MVLATDTEVRSTEVSIQLDHGGFALTDWASRSRAEDHGRIEQRGEPGRKARGAWASYSAGDAKARVLRCDAMVESQGSKSEFDEKLLERKTDRRRK